MSCRGKSTHNVGAKHFLDVHGGLKDDANIQRVGLKIRGSEPEAPRVQCRNDLALRTSKAGNRMPDKILTEG
jgi:hypothetical protein